MSQEIPIEIVNEDATMFPFAISWKIFLFLLLFISLVVSFYFSITQGGSAGDVFVHLFSNLPNAMMYVIIFPFVLFFRLSLSFLRIALNLILEVLEWPFIHIIIPFFKAISSLINWIFEKIIIPIFKYIIIPIFEHVIIPVLSKIYKILRFICEKIFTGYFVQFYQKFIRRGLQILLEFIVNQSRRIREHILKPIYDFLSPMLLKICQNIIFPLWNSISKIWEKIWEKIEPIYTMFLSVIKKISDSIVNVLDKIVGLWN